MRRTLIGIALCGILFTACSTGNEVATNENNSITMVERTEQTSNEEVTELTTTIQTTVPSSNNNSSASGNTSTYTNTNSSSSTQKVKCSECGGTGQVKYYYGASATEAYLSGHNDYEWGPCSFCHGTGYLDIKPSGSAKSSTGSNNVICPSCGKYVSGLVTKQMDTGETRKWCADCWRDYDTIIGR